MKKLRTTINDKAGLGHEIIIENNNRWKVTLMLPNCRNIIKSFSFKDTLISYIFDYLNGKIEKEKISGILEKISKFCDDNPI